MPLALFALPLVTGLALRRHPASILAICSSSVPIDIRHYIDGHGWPVVLRAAVGIIDTVPVVKVAGWRSNKAVPGPD